MRMSKYTFEEHRHRFASWASSRGASMVNYRFKVETGKKILEGSNIKKFVKTVNTLLDVRKFDKAHEKQCEKIIKAAGKHNIEFSYGVAAKILNLYLKSYFVSDKKMLDKIHPPVDSILLDGLVKSREPNVAFYNDVFREAKKTKWSKLTKNEYKKLISAFRNIAGEEGLWKMECYWRGFR